MTPRRVPIQVRGLIGALSFGVLTLLAARADWLCFLSLCCAGACVCELRECCKRLEALACRHMVSAQSHKAGCKRLARFNSLPSTCVARLLAAESKIIIRSKKPNSGCCSASLLDHSYTFMHATRSASESSGSTHKTAVHLIVTSYVT